MTIIVGATRELNIQSRRNGEVVVGTEEHPIGYSFSSSDETVVAVDAAGIITGLSVGEAEITCVLEQNNAHTGSILVSVAESIESTIEWEEQPPEIMKAYQTSVMEAAVYENGEKTQNEVVWRLSGADESAYSYKTDGNTLSITCFKASNDLTVSAEYGDVGIAMTIKMLGI